MSDETDGLAIARRRIAHEAIERTGILDLGKLELKKLPEELFTLSHLRELNLGNGILEKLTVTWIAASTAQS